MDAVEKDDLDIDAGRHLDDRLILFGSFDEIFGDGIGSIACALAQTAGQYVGARKVVAFAVRANLAGKNAVGIGRKSAPETADNSGKKGLADKIAFAAHHAAANAGFTGKADKSFDLADRNPPAGLIAGHAREFYIDFFCREIAARRTVDDAAGDIGGEQLAVLDHRAGRAGNARTTGSGSLWLATPTEASTPTMTFAGA